MFKNCEHTDYITRKFRCFELFKRSGDSLMFRSVSIRKRATKYYKYLLKGGTDWKEKSIMSIIIKQIKYSVYNL